VPINYWISFRVSYRQNVSNREEDYQERYNALNDAISKCAINSNVWKEATSFYLIESDKNINELATLIKSSIHDDEYVAIIRRIDYLSTRIIGKEYDATIINHFFPNAQKI